jgi:hypothetical protein
MAPHAVAALDPGGEVAPEPAEQGEQELASAVAEYLPAAQ